MDRLKKKVKSTSKRDISDPKDFTHVRHIGPLNLDQLDTEGNYNETTSDRQSEDKDLGKVKYSFLHYFAETSVNENM